MKDKRNIRKISVVMGIITAAAIILSQMFYVDASQFQHSVKAKAHVENGTDEPSNDVPQAVITLPSSTTPPAAHAVESEMDFLLLLDVSYHEKVEAIRDRATHLLTNKLFKTLFSTLISPNAP
jgi:hypothetical protein